MSLTYRLNRTLETFSTQGMTIWFSTGNLGNLGMLACSEVVRQYSVEDFSHICENCATYFPIIKSVDPLNKAGQQHRRTIPGSKFKLHITQHSELIFFPMDHRVFQQCQGGLWVCRMKAELCPLPASVYIPHDRVATLVGSMPPEECVKLFLKNGYRALK
jgi:hypothetical protein